ncbi:uncharacterized protein LOC119092521 [Pollicipes pollicipes]|uniref:uncharacterized protein LOC119092521 n=1 Tax=Pollicipes pollicipes TaxID=41117 RepID=UPI0018856D3C|nr:uncharacterized protein LOC119092521 [Pollicipes pollicipes]
MIYSLSLREGLTITAVLSAINYISVLHGRWGDTASPQDRSPLRAGERLLMRRIRRQLRTPSEGPLNLTRSEKADQSQYGVPDFVLSLTNNKTGGFFVECGAFDGETMSNTLLLERRYGWSGLLMEPARQLFAKMVTKRRHAWLLEACISNRPYSYEAQFQELAFLGTLEDNVTSMSWSDVSQHQQGMFYGKPMSERRQYSVPCYPLDAVLAALGSRSVDFFSLDVEGVEMGVLASIPWRQLDIKIVSVEVFLGTRWNPQLPGIVDIMEMNGYWAEPLLVDWLFVKKDSEFANGSVEKIRTFRDYMISSRRWTPEGWVSTRNLPLSKWGSDSPIQEYKVHEMS